MFPRRRSPKRLWMRISVAVTAFFAGAPENTAILRFEPHRARWVSREIWHSRQTQHVESSPRTRGHSTGAFCP